MSINYFSKPQINFEKCLHGGAGKSSCSACMDICQKPGFKIEKEGIKLPKGCNSCHFCTAHCEEGAITGAMPLIKTLEKETIIFSCVNSLKKNSIQIPCVGAVSKKYLQLVKLLNRKLEVTTGNCENCENIQGFYIFKGKLEKLGMNDSVSYKIIEGESELPSRRLIFSSLKRNLTNIPVSNEIYNKYLPETKNEIVPKFNKNCIGCTLCQSICPKKAIKREEESNSITLSINENKCNNCGKCIENCMFNALEVSENKEYLNKVTLNSQICEKCNEEYFGIAESCPKCKVRTKGRLR